MYGQRGITPEFHPPAGVFDGVLGSPPCQMWAQSQNLTENKADQVNWIPEFERVVLEAQPQWFLMENVTGAPIPQVEGYHVVSKKIYAWELGNPQRRYRRFTFGSKPPVLLLWPHGAKPARGILTRIAKQNGAKMEGERDVAETLTGAGHSGLEKMNRLDRTVIPTMTGSPNAGGYDRLHALNHLPEAERLEAMEQRRVMSTLCATNSTQRMGADAKAARGMGIPGKTTYTLEDYILGFGLREDWDAPALTKKYKFKMLGNAVAYQVAFLLAQAVRRTTA